MDTLERALNDLRPVRHRPLQGQAEPRAWAWRGFEAVEYATLEWVDRFNHRSTDEPNLNEIVQSWS